MRASTLTPPTGYVDVPLLEGERILRRWSTCFVIGGWATWTGAFVLTDRRLLLCPVELGAVPDSAGPVEAVPDQAAFRERLVAIVLAADPIGDAGVLAVRPGHDATFAEPAILHLDLDDGRTVEIGILRSAGRSTWWSGSTTVRDELVDEIALLLAGPGG